MVKIVTNVGHCRNYIICDDEVRNKKNMIVSEVVVVVVVVLSFKR